MKDYKAVIFDLDGTLLDTLGDLAGAVNYALRQSNEPERTIEQVRASVGNGVRNLMSRSVEGGEDHPNFENILSDFKSYYKDNTAVYTKPYEGVVKMLQTCKEKGLKTAVISNKLNSATNFLTDTYFPGLIDMSVGEESTRPRKPARDVGDYVLESFGLSPDDVLYIGDSSVDFSFADNVGMDCILVTYGFNDRDILATKPAMAILDKVEDILNYLP